MRLLPSSVSRRRQPLRLPARLLCPVPLRSTAALLLSPALLALSTLPLPFSTPLVPPSTAATWQGETVTKDGALHVVNPENPMEETTIQAREVWRRGGDEDEILFGLVSQLLTDQEGNAYVLDGQLSQVQVFSASGEHLRTVGREGEGPGEFRNASDMYLGPGGALGVVQIFPGKIVQLGPDGTPAGNFPLPEVPGGGFQLVFVGRALPDRVVLAGARQRRGDGNMQVQTSYLKAFDKNGKELAHFHEQSEETRFGGMKFEEKSFVNFQRRWALAPDGRVAAALDFDAYRIHVWNPDGKLNRVVERPRYAPLPRTPEAKKRFQKLFDGITRWNPGSTFQVSETHAAVGQMWFRDDGSLWVLSGRGMWERKPGVFASLDVYDREGRFVRRMHLELEGNPTEDGIFLAGDRLYRVSDLFGAFMANFGGGAAAAGTETEEAKPLEIIAFRLNAPVVGMK